ncbi:MAG TPA: DUF4446 family protein [Solirubrobacteraceae bacterium]|nr:DUF4446 family protein [Solirubrobacteraceae bacterium]
MTAASLTDTQGILALAAIAVSGVVLIAAIVLARTVRRLRTAQKLVLGEGGSRDVIAHSASLQEAFEALQEYTGDVTAGLNDRLDGIEAALAGAVSHHALVRYDAYNELSGQQSMSIALLDDRRSGIVLTCIHHRDQARVYAKQVRDGLGELELSPEEAEAVRAALEGDQSTNALAPQTRTVAPAGGADPLDAAGA